MDENGNYVIQLQDEIGAVYIPVAICEIDFLNMESVVSFLKNENISIVLKEEIRNSFEQFNNNPTLFSNHVIVISPDLVSATENPRYYVFQGYEMKCERIYYYNVVSGYEHTVSGAGAKIYANDFNQILLFAAGVYSNVISFGASLLAIYENHMGTVVNITDEDYVQVSMEYNKIKQFTYVKEDDNWNLTYTNFKHSLYCIHIREYFTVQESIGYVGRLYSSDREQNIVLRPSNFETPWGGAYIGINYPYVDYNQYKFNSTMYRFG